MKQYIVEVTRVTTHIVSGRTEGEARAKLLGDYNKIDEHTIGYRIEEKPDEA